MCGRYEMFISPENREMNRIIKLIREKYPNSENIKTGEIFPTNATPVIASLNAEIAPELFIWGFPNFRNKGVIINARSETAAEKPTFKSSLLQRRCVIPSTGFYEWKKDSTKQKFRFNMPDEENLYMAGIWNEYNGERRYVILTTAANKSMESIHNRMPIVLAKNKVEDWISSSDAALSILKEIPPELIAIKVGKDCN